MGSYADDTPPGPIRSYIYDTPAIVYLALLLGLGLGGVVMAAAYSGLLHDHAAWSIWQTGQTYLASSDSVDYLVFRQGYVVALCVLFAATAIGLVPGCRPARRVYLRFLLLLLLLVALALGQLLAGVVLFALKSSFSLIYLLLILILVAVGASVSLVVFYIGYELSLVAARFGSPMPLGRELPSVAFFLVVIFLGWYSFGVVDSKAYGPDTLSLPPQVTADYGSAELESRYLELGLPPGPLAPGAEYWPITPGQVSHYVSSSYDSSRLIRAPQYFKLVNEGPNSQDLFSAVRFAGPQKKISYRSYYGWDSTGLWSRGGESPFLGRFARPYLELPQQLKIGVAWEEHDWGAALPVVQSTMAMGFELCQVPAGNYRALRVEKVVVRHNKLPGDRHTYWLAPGVGVVRHLLMPGSFFSRRIDTQLMRRGQQ